MTSRELRERFLSFFAAKGHARVPSDALVPSGDPTVLFTSAGMNQFKRHFLGLDRSLSRAASCQKCLRTGDLDRVGRSPSHHSFFEMLGNFSFGDYFKAEAIGWAWEFMTGTLEFSGATASPDRARCLALPGRALWVSVYEQDDEAAELWRALGVPASRIRRFGQEDNFWPANAPAMGPNGPCGPCSEIYFDPDGAVGGARSVEVWNLVFTQFDRQADGTLAPLPRKNIDTGMGLERLARVVQGVQSDYETDLFAPILEAIRGLSKAARAPAEQVEFARRAIADHLRAIVFLIAEGGRPSNESRGYVLRMLIRRAHRLGRASLGLEPEPFLAAFVPAVESAMAGSPYAGELTGSRGAVAEVIRQEEAQFVQTLEFGTARLEDIMAAASGGIIPGEEAFKLYDTYGFPLELTVDIAGERGLRVDREGFDAALAAQQERSRAGSQFSGGVFVSETLPVRETLGEFQDRERQFVGYESLRSEAVIRGLWDGANWVTKAAEGANVGIVLDRSPFYGEAGGQSGDRGAIAGPRGEAEVGATVWVDDVLLHQAVVRRGALAVQDPVRAEVDAGRRLAVARGHTATHLLHWALRSVLGPEAVQAGSYVDADRLRFDFASRQALHEEQRWRIETLVNQRVRLADEVRTRHMALDEAKRSGAIAMFGEKYGARVRVVEIGDYSKELCGGTHLLHTGSVGSLAIVSEGSIAAGTRRVEAAVGEAAYARQHDAMRLLHDVARRLGRPAEGVAAGLEELLTQLRESERARKALQTELAAVTAERLTARGKQLDGAVLIAAELERTDRELLTQLADAVRNSVTTEAVVVLVSSPGPDQVAWVMATTRGLAKRLHAGAMLKTIAAMTDGSGGGRPDFAQAGGRAPGKIRDALDRVEGLVREALARAPRA